jgi:hypothetical protein
MRSFRILLALSLLLKRFVRLPFAELGKNTPAGTPVAKVEFLTDVEPPTI